MIPQGHSFVQQFTNGLSLTFSLLLFADQMQIAISWLYSRIMDFLWASKLSQWRLWAFTAILLGFLLAGEVYNQFIPPFEGPDEAQHFAYVTWLSTHRDLPPQGKDAWDTDMEQEASQPPLYYFLASLPMRFAGLSGVRPEYLPNPHYLAPLPHPIPDNENRAIHYVNYRFVAEAWSGFYLARGITRVFGLLLLIGVYGLGRQLKPDFPAMALGAAFFTASIPQVVFLSTMVSNDIPAAALSTLVLWLFAVLLRRDVKRPFLFLSLLTGICLGMAGLTKVNTLGLSIPLLLGYFYIWVSGQWPWQRTVLSGLLLGLGTTAVTGWWFVHNWLTYYSPVGLDTHSYAPWSLNNSGVLVSFTARWIEIVRSFWIALGWGALRPNEWAYTIWFILGGLALLGLILFLVRAGRNRKLTEPVTVFFVIFLVLSILVMSVLLEYWMRQVVAVHGRLLFPAVGAISLLLVLGWHHIHPRLPWLGYGYTFIWALAIPLTLLKPAYTPEYLPKSAKLPATLGWEIWEADKPIMELKQVNVPETAVAGELLPIELCWQAVAETATDYSFLVQIIGPENSLIASRRTYPGHGLIPTSDWLVGREVCETTYVPVPDELEKSLLYQVETTLIDHSSETRLTVINSDGIPLSQPFSGQIKLHASSTTDVKDLASDQPFYLISSEFAPIWQSGEEASLQLSWAVPAHLEKDYQVFVHLRDDNGDTLAQGDGPPLAGWYPTSQWTPKEIVVDERIFLVPEDLPAGQYTLITGFYDVETGDRLGNEAIVGQVKVEQSEEAEG